MNLFFFWRRRLQSGTANAARPRPQRPGLEALEDRTVPSTLFVSPTGSYTWGTFINQPAFKTIQAAVNAAKSGDSIEVGPGAYSEAVTVPKAVILLGAQADNNPTTTSSTAAQQSIVNGPIVVNANDVTIDGFTVQNNSTVDGISLTTGTKNDVVKDNIVSANFINIGLENSDSAKVEDNVVTGAVTDGIVVGDSKNDSVTGNLVTLSGFVGGQGQGIQIANTTDTTVSGNTVSNNHSSGIEVTTNASHDTLSGNLVTDDGGEGIGLGTASYITVSGNTVTGSDIGIALEQADFNHIDGNTVTSAHKDGIGLGGANSITVSGNNLFGNYQNIVLEQSDGSTVKGNVVENATTDGIVVGDSKDDRIADNTVLHNGFGAGQGQGIVIANTTGTTMSGNTVSDNATDGIEVTTSSSGDTVSGNTVDGNGGDGIGLGGANSITVSHNNLSGNFQNIVLEQSDGSTVNNNIVQGATTDGIVVGDSKLDTVNDNTVLLNGVAAKLQAQGIQIANTTGTTVRGNLVTSNATDGIEVTTSSSGDTIADNAVTNNGGDGIGLGSASSITVSGNNLSGNLTNIDLVSALNNVIKNNTGSDALEDGIRVDSTSKGNTFTSNTMLGDGLLDAEDDSTGTGTDGTANTWTKNHGATSNPAGLVS